MANFQVPEGAKRLGPINALIGTQPTQVAGVSPSFWFSPLQPVTPTAPSDYKPRQWGYQPGANLIWQPKSDEGYGYDLLRQLSLSWDLLRMALEMKKDEIGDVEFELRLKRQDNEKQADYKNRTLKGAKELQDLKQFWAKPDGFNTFRQWLRMLSEDLLVCDAVACYLPRDNKGKVAMVMPTDGASWNRLLTDQGITPRDPTSAAYQQVCYGFPAWDGTTQDVVFSMQNPTTYRRYGYSRVERCLTTVAFGIRRQMFQIAEYCYSSDTEVLTSRGWLKWPDVTMDDTFATRRMESGEFEWQKAEGYIRKQFNGNLIRFKNVSLDILVTPNHRMLVGDLPGRYQRGCPTAKVPRIKECLVEASNLALQRALSGPNISAWIPQVSEWNGGVRIEDKVWLSPNNKEITVRMTGDQYCAFMGIYLAEGCVGGSEKPTLVHICQPKDKKGIHQIFSDMLSEIFGADVHHDGKMFSWSRKSLALYLRQFGLANEKFIPEEIKNAPKDQLQIFWRYYALGDGESATAIGEKKRSQQVFTVSKKLSDDLTEVVQKIGLRPNVGVRAAGKAFFGKPGLGREINASEGYTITATDQPCTRNWDVEFVPYDGEVFCVSVPNHTLYVRRNGKHAWCGNTAGNIPEAFLFMPSDIPPQRLKEFQDYIDSILSGNLAERRKIRMMPGFGDSGKPNIVFPKEALLKDELDVWLAQLVCAIVGVSAQPFLKMVNRASSEEANDAAREKWLKPDVDFFCEYINTCLERMGMDQYEIAAKAQRDTDPLKQAQADAAVWGKVYTPNELREQRGEDPVEGKNANRLGVLSPMNGFMPLDPDDDDLALMQQMKATPPKPDGSGGGGGSPAPNGGGSGGSPKPKTKPSAKKSLAATWDLEKDHKYGCIMVPIDPASEAGLRMKAMRDAIPDADLMEGNGTSREEEPHVTVRYGIKDGGEGLPEYLTGLAPFTLKFGKTMAFAPSEQSDGAAPLVVQVDSPELHAVNAQLAQEATFKEATFDYHPHATLAYVAPERAQRYVDDDYLDGVEYPVRSIVITMPDGSSQEIMLTGGFAAPAKFSGSAALRPASSRIKNKNKKPTKGVTPPPIDLSDSTQIDSGYRSSPGATQSSTVAVEDGGQVEPGGVDENNPAEDPPRADHKPMQRTVHAFFKAQAAAAFDRLKRIGELHKVIKASDDGDDQDDDAERIGEAELLSAANDINWRELIPQVLAHLQEAGNFGVVNGLHRAAVAGVGETSASIGPAQTLAAEYAKDRAAEMVGMKWVDGELVENPNAMWAISDTTRDQLREIIAQALSEETPIDVLAERIRDAGSFSESRAETIANTEIATAQEKGVTGSWKATGAVEKVRWSPSSLGPCPECLDNVLAGSIPFGDTFPTGVLAPPNHPNCFAGDAVVSASGVSVAYSRWFEGEVIILRVSGAPDITVTPNHPILTQRGWVAAGDLELTDKVLQCVDPNLAVSLMNPDDNHMETGIQEIAHTLGMSHSVLFSIVPTSTEDFHGDGIANGKVDIVGTAGALSCDQSDRIQHRENTLLCALHERGLLLNSDCVHPFGIFGDDSSATGSMSSSGLMKSLVFGQLSHADNGGFMGSTDHQTRTLESFDDHCMVGVMPFPDRQSRLTSQVACVHSHQFGQREFAVSSFAHRIARLAKRDSRTNQVKTNHTVTKLVSRTNSLERVASLIRFADVVKLWKNRFAGHVFNLSTDTGTYFANTILAHNCRCALIITKVRGKEEKAA